MLLLFSHWVVCDSLRLQSQAPLSFTISWSLVRFMSIKSVTRCNHLILCCPLLLLSSIFPSIRVFSNELALRIRWLKYWSFSFSISPTMNIQDWFPLGLTGLISFPSKGLSSLLQHHSSKASVLRTCACFLLLELQNYNSLLNNHWEENVGSHQKRYPMSKGKGEGPARW